MKKDFKAFIDYMRSPLEEDFTHYIYNEYGVTEKLCSDYMGYINKLLDKVFTTYLGDDCMTLKSKYEHFMWCWNKTKDEHEPPFDPNDEVMIWIGDFLNETWYSQDDKELMSDKVKEFWNTMFDISRPKTRPDLDFIVGFFVLVDKEKSIIKK